MGGTDLPITIKAGEAQYGDHMVCVRCLEKIKPEENYIHWSVTPDSDHEFIWCWRHNNPTKLQVAMSVFEAFGYDVQAVGNKTYKVHRINLRQQVTNPASPSFISLSDLMSFYEEPLQSRLLQLIKEKRVPNKYMMEQAKAEIAEEDLDSSDGIRRGARVLGKDRHCSECGISEKETIAQNPKYTLCRRVCVKCYRKLFRGKPLVGKKETW